MTHDTCEYSCIVPMPYAMELRPYSGIVTPRHTRHARACHHIMSDESVHASQAETYGQAKRPARQHPPTAATMRQHTQRSAASDPPIPHADGRERRRVVTQRACHAKGTCSDPMPLVFSAASASLHTHATARSARACGALLLSLPLLPC